MGSEDHAQAGGVCMAAAVSSLTGAGLAGKGATCWLSLQREPLPVCHRSKTPISYA